MSNPAHYGEYSLATGAAAVRRLKALHEACSPVGRRVLLQAGLAPGMNVADFGCGIGAVTRMLAEMVGPTGHVTGIDVNADQLVEAARHCAEGGHKHVTFHESDACVTGLPRASFDLVYCRFLLLHLPDPAACLAEMRALLKPGGILVVEDGDLTSAHSVPSTAQDAFGDLFGRLGPTRALDYAMARNLYHLVKAAGFDDPEVEMHHPTMVRGVTRYLLKWSVEEAGPAFIGANLITKEELDQKLQEMQKAIDDPNVLIIGPLMVLVSARKT
jgi:SAM-dependent methyltransferase